MDSNAAVFVEAMVRSSATSQPFRLGCTTQLSLCAAIWLCAVEPPSGAASYLLFVKSESESSKLAVEGSLRLPAWNLAYPLPGRSLLVPAVWALELPGVLPGPYPFGPLTLNSTQLPTNWVFPTLKRSQWMTNPTYNHFPFSNLNTLYQCHLTLLINHEQSTLFR